MINIDQWCSANISGSKPEDQGWIPCWSAKIMGWVVGDRKLLQGILPGFDSQSIHQNGRGVKA